MRVAACVPNDGNKQSEGYPNNQTERNSDSDSFEFKGGFGTADPLVNEKNQRDKRSREHSCHRAWEQTDRCYFGMQQGRLGSALR